MMTSESEKTNFNNKKQTISDYLIHRIQSYGIDHVFGVPGDYILDFFNKLVHTKGMEVINTCDEQGAAFAADAYARIRGLGVVCVTYSVGGLKIVNAVAQAFSEKSPLVVISGSPGINDRHNGKFLPHHKVQNFDTQQKIFEYLTIDSALIQDPFTAAKDIDRVLSSAFSYKLPVYLELPQDVENLRIVKTHNHQNDFFGNQFSTRDSLYGHIRDRTDSDALKEAISESVKMINSSKKPVIIVGVESHRFGLQKKIMQLINETKIPVVSTLLSKSVISEDNVNYLGVYSGNLSQEHVQKYVESSDCIILIGVFLTNVSFGITAHPIDQSRSIYIAMDDISVRFHKYANIRFEDFLDELIKKCKRTTTHNTNLYFENSKNNNLYSNQVNHRSSSKTSNKITVKKLFEILDTVLSKNDIVIADVGDSLFGSIDLKIKSSSSFLSPAYYLSMGFAVPASIGAQIANSKLRPIVLVGDGAFQMTGMEVSTIAMLNLNPIIIVLNNNGYRTERAILDGKFNNIQRWNYSKIPDVVGKGKGFVVETEEQFKEFISVAKCNENEFYLFDVRLDTNDSSSALQRLSEGLRKN
ncbi:MAG: alpha-keto acid decarboxylase family protein [Nitrososphaeraceae archaeon]